MASTQEKIELYETIAEMQKGRLLFSFEWSFSLVETASSNQGAFGKLAVSDALWKRNLRCSTHKSLVRAVKFVNLDSLKFAFLTEERAQDQDVYEESSEKNAWKCRWRVRAIGTFWQ